MHLKHSRFCVSTGRERAKSQGAFPVVPGGKAGLAQVTLWDEGGKIPWVRASPPQEYSLPSTVHFHIHQLI